MAAVAVWRRPIVALYVFIVGLALHNLVLALLYDAGLRGGAIDAVQAWKEALLAVAVARVATDAVRERRLPFRPRVVDWLALAFAAVVCLYALIPQDVLDGEAGARAVLYGLRHGLVPVVAYFLGRSLVVDRVELRRIGWALLGAGAALAVGGLVDLYAVDVEWWRGSGAVGYFRYELGFDYHGPGGLPDNWAFNTEDGLFRRLVSSFISPLATAFALVVALLFAGIAWQDRRRRPLAAVLVAVCAAALLFTLSRSSLLALAGAFVVLAVALRRWWPVVATAVVLAAGVGFAFAFTSVAPETHFFPEDLPYQEEQARKHGDLPGGSSLALNPGEPSLRSHWQSLRDGIETVFEHPQGYGLGNAGRDRRPLRRAAAGGRVELHGDRRRGWARRRAAAHRVEPRASGRARALGVGRDGRNVPGGRGRRCSRSRRRARARRADRCVRRALARLQPLVALRVACRPVRPGLTATLGARST